MSSKTFVILWTCVEFGIHKQKHRIDKTKGELLMHGSRKQTQNPCGHQTYIWTYQLLIRQDRELGLSDRNSHTPLLGLPGLTPGVRNIFGAQFWTVYPFTNGRYLHATSTWSPFWKRKSNRARIQLILKRKTSMSVTLLVLLILLNFTTGLHFENVQVIFSIQIDIVCSLHLYTVCVFLSPWIEILCHLLAELHFRLERRLRIIFARRP